MPASAVCTPDATHTALSEILRAIECWAPMPLCTDNPKAVGDSGWDCA